MFFGFTNFYKRFIWNFNRIAASLTSILQTTNIEAPSIQVTKNKRNEAVLANTGSSNIDNRVGESIENLLTIVNLAKSRLTKPKKARLPITKANFGTNFLTFGAKKAFIYSWKVFTKAAILGQFNPKCHILIETDFSGYAIDEVLS